MVRLYAVEVQPLAERFEALTARLGPARRARVLQRGPTGDGLRSLAAGLLLLEVLGLREEPPRLMHNKHGKPYLSGGTPFNLSHAENYAVLATADAAVGVDVEYIRPIAYERIASRFFHAEECAYMRAAADPAAAFFTLWTLKESYLKAEGQGFSVSPQSFCILPAGEDGAAFLDGSGYSFRRYHALEGYRLAACSGDSAFSKTIELLSF